MTDIKLLRISLMEKKGEIKDEAGKADYIVKSSANFQFNEYVEKTYPEADEEDREQILKEASQLIYEDLLSKSKEDEFNSVGIWLTVGDQVLENAIDTAVLGGIKEYGQTGIVPIFEFIKMTLPVNE